VDLTAPFKTEVLRPITTLVVPGSIAVAPYILVLGFYIPAAARFWETHGGAAAVVITICVLAAGLILENIGASIEVMLWDTVLQSKDATHLPNWDRYLELEMKDELIAQRYLESLVMRMKFELSMAPALLVFWVGLTWLNYLYTLWSVPGSILTSALLALGAVYFLRCSYISARVLSHVRKLILEAAKDDTFHKS
jgi:hypothetical protein